MGIQSAISSLVPGGVGHMPEHLDPWNTPVMDAWSCIVLWMVGGPRNEMARASTMLCLCVCGVRVGVHMRARAPERHARANSTHTRQQETRGLSPSRGSPNRPAHRADRSNARRTNPAASPDEGARASGTFRQTKRERLRPEPACQGRNGRPQRVAPSPTDSRPPLHAGNNGCTYTPYQRRKRWQPAEHGGLTKQHGPASACQTRTR